MRSTYIRLYKYYVRNYVIDAFQDLLMQRPNKILAYGLRTRDLGMYSVEHVGDGISQSVEALYFTIELHTSSVRVRVQPGTKYLYGKISVGNVAQMWVIKKK